MRRVVAVLGLVVVLGAFGSTLLPFTREAPRTTPTRAATYGASGWQHATPAPCANSWQTDGSWCATTGAHRRTAALAVGGTATLSAAIIVVLLPRRRRKVAAHPAFSVPTSWTSADQRIAA